MIHRIIFLIVAVAFVGLLFAAENVDEAKEIEAIKTVIHNQTMHWANRNYEGWADTWLHETNTISVVLGKHFHMEDVGWENISKTYKKSLTRSSPVPMWRQENVNIRVDGNLAWATFDSYSGIETHHREFKSLIKKDGEWKTASITVIFDDSYKATAENIERDLDVTGHQLLEMEKIKEAIDVFALNAKFYPESGSAYASLGEAYMKAGNTELASKNFKKSLQLNPDNTTAKEMLKKMSAK